MRFLVFVELFVWADVMELVDVVDSKSTDSDVVPVRVRPSAPFFIFAPHDVLLAFELAYRSESYSKSRLVLEKVPENMGDGSV